MLTYKKLLEELQSMDEIQLAETVTVFFPENGEYIGIEDYDQVIDSDVLDEGHTILILGKVELPADVIEEAEAELEYPLTDEQKKFIIEARKQGLEVYYNYSGRAMYGKKCPAVDLDRGQSFSFPKARQDSMGLGSVIYLPRW